MSKLRKILRNCLGNKNYQQAVLIINYFTDYRLYKVHSSIFKQDTFEKLESEITLRYHSIEKGFLHSSLRFKFAKKKVVELIKFLKDKNVIEHYEKAQIQSAFNCLCKYYDFHLSNNISISDFYSDEDYCLFKEKLLINSDVVIRHTKDSYFSSVNKDFESFSNSRCSVRDFTGEKIPINLIQKVVDLANNAPSVCNRQPSSVYLLENKSIIDEILKIQGGLTGYSQKLEQLIVLTCNRNYFYSTGERNQLYTDGGIYLLNLLYALHYYNIGACPAHWGLPVHADSKARVILNLSNSEQIVCLVAIGVPHENFATTLSSRKKHDENLFVIN